MNKESSSRCNRTSNLPRLGDVDSMAFSILVVFSPPDGDYRMVIRRDISPTFSKCSSSTRKNPA